MGLLLLPLSKCDIYFGVKSFVKGLSPGSNSGGCSLVTKSGGFVFSKRLCFFLRLGILYGYLYADYLCLFRVGVGVVSWLITVVCAPC